MLDATGGIGATLSSYAAARPHGSAILPPLTSQTGAWTGRHRELVGRCGDAYVRRHSVELLLPARALLPLGPRRTEDVDRSGLLTMAFVIPPLLAGMAAYRYPWPTDLLARVTANPAETLPLMLRQTAPGWVALLGLVGIIGAVTSSFSSSILSAATMFSWNCCKRLIWPPLSANAMKRLIRIAVGLLGAG